MPIFTTDSKRILFVHIPKTGGATIEQHLRRFGKIDLFNGRPQGSDLPCSPQHFHIKQLKSLFNFNKFDYIFTVMRCPFERLKSEFKMRKKSQIKKCRKDNHKTALPDFNTWVGETLGLYNQNPFIYDNHIRPQTEFINNKVKIFDFELGVPNILQQVFLDLDINFYYDDDLRRQTGLDIDIDMSTDTYNKIELFYKDDVDFYKTIQKKYEPLKAINQSHNIQFNYQENNQKQKGSFMNNSNKDKKTIQRLEHNRKRINDVLKEL